jgi:predicted RNA binding protein YcfA (HicA-like mRNA interferase family)
MGYDIRKARKDLRKDGGHFVRNGKHEIWEVNGIEVALPRHGGKDLSKKVIKDIENALGHKVV